MISKSQSGKKLSSTLYAVLWKFQHLDLLVKTRRNALQVPTAIYLRFVDLEKLKDWQKRLDGVPLVMEESVVKEFLIGAGYNQQAVRKYKTLRAWERKEGIQSVK